MRDANLPYVLIFPESPEAGFKLAQMGLVEGLHYQSAMLAREYRREGHAVPFVSFDPVTVITLPFTSSEGPSYANNSSSIWELYSRLISAFTFYEIDNERRWHKWAKADQDGPPFAYDVVTSGAFKPLSEVPGATEWIALTDGREWAFAGKTPTPPVKEDTDSEFERWSSYGMGC